jgi:hypothetical protein
MTVLNLSLKCFVTAPIAKVLSHIVGLEELISCSSSTSSFARSNAIPNAYSSPTLLVPGPMNYGYANHFTV